MMQTTNRYLAALLTASIGLSVAGAATAAIASITSQRCAIAKRIKRSNMERIL